MSVSHFMEIQQKERESLAAYIHRFKRGSQQMELQQQCSNDLDIHKGT